MKAILSSILAGSLLATFAVAQSSRSVVAERSANRGAGHETPARRHFPAYVITLNFQFGVIDLRSGAFVPVGPALPPDVGDGLVPGPGRSLLTLAFSGNLDKIDPLTGVTSVVGATGLGDCSAPGSYDPTCANYIGRHDGRFYATDFAQNLYSVDPMTGAAKLIGTTGIPAITFAPFSENPDGSVNVYDESLFSAHGKFYALFGTSAVNFSAGTLTPLIPGGIYRINPETGLATLITPADSALSSVMNVNDTIYAFNAWTGQVVTVDLTTGQTTAVSDVDPAAGIIVGATAARPEDHH